jgi:hypothetical protein
MRRRVIELERGRVVRDEATAGYRAGTGELDALLREG